ncbi:DDE-type integrase/transposase/recombinase [Variovorax guangxiensis]|uniref:Transposase n=1 Tax=Variovorax guangxiensis TaxID=1775474 RepID=A0A502DUS4_9BURK|nr:DDE-type integrase/transposase/recombinase [Variovorax guangxiensis]TPG24966.1 transposase [Variovorax ginsengisoli]TPG29218.1 transposase [Variovorax guangxiensis]
MNSVREHDELFELGAAQPTLVVTKIGLPYQRVCVLNLARDQEEVIKLSELRDRISAGELIRRRPGDPRVPPAMQTNPALDKATAMAQAHLSRICQYSERYDVSIHQAYHAVRKSRVLVGADATPPHFPSLATMYRHLEATRNGQPILCGDANKGNRTPRYGEALVQLIVSNAKAHHQKPGSRWTVASLTRYCNIQAQDSGLLPAERNISRKFVEKVIQTHLSADAEVARLLPHLRAAQKAVARYSIRVNGFLQRVEQDALHLPWRVHTSAGELRDIYLVHAIDVATGLPVGWALSVGAPTAATSFACVESILYSKKALLSALNVRMDADFYGAPGCIVFDNGPEAKNDRIGGLVRLGIEVQYCKSRHPQHKPFIERLNRALKEALETLPGCTRMDGKDGSRDPGELGDLPMPLDELERWIVRWYYEDWALRPLERLIRADFSDAGDMGATPMARYQRMELDGFSMPLPPNIDDWRRVKCELIQRTLARTTGITVDGFHFRGRHLDRLMHRFGETMVDVLIDPDDFRTVHVADGDELVALVNADVDESTPVLSFSEAKAREKAARDAALAQGASITNQLRRDLYAASEKTGKRVGKPSGAGASKEARNQVKLARAVEQARARPLEAQSAPNAASMDEFSLDQLAALPVVDRRTGEVL